MNDTESESEIQEISAGADEWVSFNSHL
jgi:hypothetical protein